MSRYSTQFLVPQSIPETLFVQPIVSGSHWFGVFSPESTSLRIYLGHHFRPGSTVDTCTASVDVAFGRISHIFCVKVTSDPEVDLPFALLGVGCHRRLHEIGDFWEMNLCFRIRRVGWYDSGYMHCVSSRCFLEEFPHFLNENGLQNLSSSGFSPEEYRKFVFSG